MFAADSNAFRFSARLAAFVALAVVISCSDPDSDSTPSEDAATDAGVADGAQDVPRLDVQPDIPGLGQDGGPTGDAQDATADVPDMGWVCVEDAFSPNHTSTSPAPIAIGDDHRLALCEATEDWFRLSLEAGELAYVQISFDSEYADLDLEAYDAPDAPYAIEGSWGVSGTEAISLSPQTQTDYFIRVYPFYGEAAYRLTVTSACFVDADCDAPQTCLRQPGAPYDFATLLGSCGTYVEPSCGADGARDPNGTDGRAVQVEFSGNNASISGLSTCSDDLDFFKVTVANGDTLTADIEWTSETVDVYLYLADADGTILPTRSAWATEPLSLPFLPAGDYTFIVASAEAWSYYYDYSGEETAYTLSLTKEAGSCDSAMDCVGAPTGGFCVDGACTTIDGDGAVALGGSCDSADDCVEAADGCYTGSQSSDGWICTVSCSEDAPDCSAVASTSCFTAYGMCALGCGAGVAADDLLCPASTYCHPDSNCVSRNCYGDSECARDDLFCVVSSSYLMGSCDVPPVVECGQTGTGEPNNTDSIATPIPLVSGEGELTGQSLCREDIDLYSVVLTEAGSLSVNVTYGVDADINLVVYEQGAKSTVAYGFSYELRSETVEAPMIPAGTYIIRAYMWTELETDLPYTIAVDFDAGGCVDSSDCDDITSRRFCGVDGGCYSITGDYSVPLGGACDSWDDCDDTADGCLVASASPEGWICTLICSEADTDCSEVPGTTCLVETGACALPCDGGGADDDNLCPSTHLCNTGECVSRACWSDAECDELRSGLDCALSSNSLEGLCGELTAPDCGLGAGETEPNHSDTSAEPVVLSGGTASLTGLGFCQEDLDVFSLTTTEAGSLAVTLTVTGTADVDIYIMAQGGESLVGYGVTDLTTGEVASAEYLVPGTYLIRVYPYSVTGDVTYTLNVTFAAADCNTADVADPCLDTNPTRLECAANGGCDAWEGAGTAGLGDDCDSDDDCVETAALCNYFGDARAGQSICTILCYSDVDCTTIPGSTCQPLNYYYSICLP